MARTKVAGVRTKLVEIFGHPNCFWCKQANEYVAAQARRCKRPFEVVLRDIRSQLNDDEIRGRLRTHVSDKRKKRLMHDVPRVFVDNEYVGGCDEVVRYFEAVRRNRV